MRPGSGVHRLFEDQVRRTPDLLAVVAGRSSVSYRDLNARANALAHHLLRHGSRPEGFVGLIAERSIEMVVGVLGILKAGAVHVPLNPEYPLERLALMTRDVDLRLVVTTPTQHGLGSSLGIETMALPAALGNEPDPNVELAPEQLAYAIFTSGSTGRPKAVALPHEGLVSLLTFSREQMQIGPGDRVLQFASFSFDASLWEILVALASGATLVAGTSDELMPGPALHRFLREHAVTVALLSPSVLQVLSPEGLGALRILVAGTEKLTAGVVSRWRAPGRRIFNAYGPTEATIYQTIWEAPSGEPPDPPPIGTPTPGVGVYILGEDQKPVEDGAGGELCIAGACLGRGYVNRPELTREKFVSLPLGPSGEMVRVYRSGDRARKLPDGNIAYLGRLDLQLKVRGFRVEPGEVEAALEEHPAVDSSAVAAHTDGVGQTRLWAYFSPRALPIPTGTDLRAFLAARLPDYMVPSGFSVMERWPLNANGKLDRSRLPPPGAQPEQAVTPSRQLSATEERLLSWCRDIAGDHALGPDDALLDAGFHSLALAQLSWRVQDGFGASPPFSEMFARRTVAELASWIDSRTATDQAALRPVAPADRSGPLPLSAAQQRVWFLERLHPGNNAYRFQSILELHGRTDVAALEGALNEVVRRHEILRTTFPAIAGRPFQSIHEHQPFALAVEEATATAAQAAIDRSIREPFDLDRLPLARWRLFRIAPDEHWLLHTEHHLLHDGWSYGVFLRELFAAYDALASGRPPDLPDLPVQFADLAAWQQHQIDRGVWDTQLDYWERTLRDAEAPWRLPSERPGRATQSFAGDQIRHPIDPTVYAELVAACLREHVTPYMWLHATFQTFLHRYTGQTEIVVGTGIANRRSSESQLLLGMMLNTVAMRTDFAGDPPFRELLARFRTTAVAAMDNQDAPYDQVVKRLQPGEELFNCFFDSYDQAFTVYRNEDLRVESIDGISNGTSKFDLTALVIPGDGAPTLLWEYDTDRFTRPAAERMMRHFLALVQGSVAQPDLPVSRLPMLAAEEREHLLRLGRGPEPVLPGDRIERIFADRAAACPHAEALVCGDERLSYAELDRRAEDLADRLRREGVVSGGVVAISLPRGVDAIAAMLAILKCGCAYLPLDPALPAARREVLLQAVSPAAMVTAGGIIALRQGSGAAEAPAADDAYVMFTSGSTGVPKAVYAPHRGVIRLVCGVDYVRLDATTRMLQLAPLSFDASTFEIWGPLLNGGTVVVHTEDLPDSTELGRAIVAGGVSTLYLATALFNSIVETKPEVLRPVQQVVVGGEMQSARHVARALRELPDATIVNGYGPTEATTFATAFTVPKAFDQSSLRVPIGMPIARTQVYVLDVHREVQPIGVDGEIYIGGEGLGRYADAGLDRTAFVPDPFAAGARRRLYRTGDRARLLADGNVDFIERIDRQVKLHGYRIEPGEIEAVIARHGDVREAAVLAVADPAGERRLVAFLVLAPQAGANAVESVREFVSRWLPSYMVPSSIVSLPALPLSPHGKLDTRALEQMAAAPPATARDTRGAPRAALEAVIAGVWGPVLGIESPSVDDNFFDVGGHSLLALRMIHDLNVALGLELPVRSIFTDPTIAGIARAIEAELAKRFGGAKRYDALVPLKPGGDRPPFFLVAGGVGGENELIVYAGLARYMDPRRPFFGLRARGVDELVEPHANVEEMAAEYNRYIRRVQPEGPYTIGGACAAGVVALEMAQQMRRANQEVRTLVLLDSFIPRWSRYMRNELVRVWNDLLRPDLERARADGVVKVASEWRRRLSNPSPDEQIAYRRLQIMRTYLARLTAYRPLPYPGDVVLLRAEHTDEKEARRWRSIATGRFEMHDIPGDHSSHLREYASVTMTRLEECLAAADDSG